MKNKIYEQIKKHKVIIIHRHSRPDGDAIGSQIGLKEAIKRSFPYKKVFVVGDENEKFNFLGKMIIEELSIPHKTALKTLKKIMSNKENPTEMEKLLISLKFSAMTDVKNPEELPEEIKNCKMYLNLKGYFLANC